jgi:hypothetical protein
MSWHAVGSAIAPPRRCPDPGYATVIAFTDEIGLLKPAYGIWQELQAAFALTEMVVSNNSSWCAPVDVVWPGSSCRA